MTNDPRCGYTVLDSDGIEQPCDRTASGWRWYQDVEHEDCLQPACDWHANEGGRRIRSAEATLERVRKLTDGIDLGDAVYTTVIVAAIRRALDGDGETS